MTDFTIIARPADDLAWFFFCLIAGIFLLAIILAAAARRDIRKAKAQDDLHDDMYLGSDSLGAIKENLRPASLAVALALPSVELVVGLLGTFIGICLAIYGASDALSVESGTSLTSAEQMTRLAEQSSALQDMLKRIGLQFQTSIWGICANLLTRLAVHLVGEQPLSVKATEVKENLSKARQTEAQRTEATRKKEMKYLGTLANAARHVDAHRTHVLVNLTGIFETTKGLQAGQTASQETLDTLVKRVEALEKSQRSNLVNIRNGLDANQQSLSKHHEKLLAANKRIATLLTQADKSRAEQHQSLAEQFAQQHEHSVQQSKRRDAQSAQLLEQIATLQTASTADATRIVDAVQELRNRLASIPKEIERLAEQIDKVKDAGEKMAGAAQALDGSAQSLQGAAQDLKRSLNESVEDLGRTVTSVKDALDETIQQMQDRIAEELQSLGTSLETHLSELQASQTQTFEAVEQTLQELNKAVRSIAPHLEASLDKMETALAEVLAGINQSLTEQLAQLRDAQRQNATELREASQADAERMRAVIANVHGALDTLKESLHGRLGELASIAKQMDASIEGNQFAITKLKSQLGELTKATLEMEEAAHKANLRLDDLAGDGDLGIGEQVQEICTAIRSVAASVEELRTLATDAGGDRHG